MFIEVTLAPDELALALSHVMPCKFVFDSEGKHKDDRFLQLGAPQTVELIPGRGVRVTCQAVVGWGFAGVEPTATIDSLAVMLTPSTTDERGQQDLQVCVSIEDADFKSLPALIDDVVVAGINAALSHRPVIWDFRRTLSTQVALPKFIQPWADFLLACEWAKVAVTANGIAATLSFNVDFGLHPQPSATE